MYANRRMLKMEPPPGTSMKDIALGGRCKDRVGPHVTYKVGIVLAGGKGL
jgi:hypothetical protein